MNGFFFSGATWPWRAPAGSWCRPISMSTPWVSNHSRAWRLRTVGLVLVVGDRATHLLAGDRAAGVGKGHADASRPAGPSMSA
jgi:hypothetical protein